MNIKRIMLLLFTISVLGMLGFLPKLSYSCTVTDSNVLSPTYNQQIFGNCTIDNNVAANGINIFTNTLAWNIPNGWFLLWVGASVGMAIMFLAQDRSWARFNTAIFASLVLAIIMRMFNLVRVTPVIVAASLLGLSILASFFLHQNR